MLCKVLVKETPRQAWMPVGALTALDNEDKHTHSLIIFVFDKPACVRHNCHDVTAAYVGVGVHLSIHYLYGPEILHLCMEFKVILHSVL